MAKTTFDTLIFARKLHAAFFSGLTGAPMLKRANPRSNLDTPGKHQ